MTDKQGYEDIEYEDGAEPPKLRFVISQRRMTIGELLSLDELSRQEQLKFVARFLVNEENLFATRCIRKRDGSLEFFGIEDAAKIISNMPPKEWNEIVNRVVESVAAIQKSAVPLATSAV